MAFIQCSFHSATLCKECNVNLIVPQLGMTEPAKKFPVLYLLHGLSDDYSCWMRRTAIERYANEYQLVVVMPDGGRSFYANMKHGGMAYWNFLAQELPAMVKQMFPISDRREDTFAAGLSMGGYGALKLGLSFPEKFAAIGALSAVCDIPEKFDNPEFNYWHQEFRYIFGSKTEAIADGCDLFTLMKQAQDRAQVLPKILQIEGDEDFMIKENRRLKAAFEAAKWPVYSYFEAPGTHNWMFWDTHIQEVIKFIMDK